MTFSYDLNDEVSFQLTGTIVTRSERNDRDEPQYVVRHTGSNGAVSHRTFSESELRLCARASLPPAILRRVA